MNIGKNKLGHIGSILKIEPHIQIHPILAKICKIFADFMKIATESLDSIKMIAT